MPKYRVAGVICNSKYIGDFEADSPEEAIEQAEQADNDSEILEYIADVFLASAAMQAGGTPRRDQHLPNATSPGIEQPLVCPCCNEAKCECFGSGCPICHLCQGHCVGLQEHTPERICMVPRDQITLVDTNGTDVIGTLEMDDSNRIAFCRADGALISLTDETELDTIFAGIMRKRADQDKQWGGPDHDDTHTPADWCEFIQKFRNRAEFMGIRGRHENYENALFDILGLATAAIESCRRKRVMKGANWHERDLQ